MEIEFSTHEEYYNLKEDHPTPIKVNIPDWYKKLEHGKKHDQFLFKKTIKGCMPFLETLTNGYLLRVHIDYYIKHGTVKDDEGKRSISIQTSLEHMGEAYYANEKGININTSGIHRIEQLEGAPAVEKNGKVPFHKIANPWFIKTPRGYSCLFLNPLNNQEQDRFSIMPGIVHTDQYNLEINFPIIVNHEKYGDCEFKIPKGTPYVQVIPFKRDDWKMKIKKKSTKQSENKMWNLTFLNRYKDLIFNKGKSSWT